MGKTEKEDGPDYGKLLKQIIQDDGLDGAILFTMKRAGEKIELMFQREAAEGHAKQIAVINCIFREALQKSYQDYLEDRIKQMTGGDQ